MEATKLFGVSSRLKMELLGLGKRSVANPGWRADGGCSDGYILRNEFEERHKSGVTPTIQLGCLFQQVSGQTRSNCSWAGIP
jgi:hypothetical protein